MGIPLLDPEQVVAVVFVFLRIGAMLVMIPVIGEASVPVRVKGGLAILITLLVYPVVRPDIPAWSLQTDTLGIAWAILGEILIGVFLGFAAKLVFAGIRFGGGMIGMQMGFAIVNVIDPATRTQSSIIAEFQYMVAVLVYLIVDAHHLLILAITESYRFIPPTGFHFSGALMEAVITFSQAIFVTAVKISAPIMAVLLFTNVALGIVARTVPQINIFIVGFPLQIAVGLVFLGLTVPVVVILTQRVLAGLSGQIQVLLRLM
jgi:flagellar biosynthesis protein FliR